MNKSSIKLFFGNFLLISIISVMNIHCVSDSVFCVYISKESVNKLFTCAECGLTETVRQLFGDVPNAISADQLQRFSKALADIIDYSPFILFDSLTNEKNQQIRLCLICDEIEKTIFCGLMESTPKLLNTYLDVAYEFRKREYENSLHFFKLYHSISMLASNDQSIRIVNDILASQAGYLLLRDAVEIVESNLELLWVYYVESDVHNFYLNKNEPCGDYRPLLWFVLQMDSLGNYIASELLGLIKGHRLFSGSAVEVIFLEEASCLLMENVTPSILKSTNNWTYNIDVALESGLTRDFDFIQQWFAQCLILGSSVKLLSYIDAQYAKAKSSNDVRCMLNCSALSRFVKQGCANYINGDQSFIACVTTMVLHKDVGADWETEDYNYHRRMLLDKVCAQYFLLPFNDLVVDSLSEARLVLRDAVCAYLATYFPAYKSKCHDPSPYRSQSLVKIHINPESFHCANMLKYLNFCCENEDENSIALRKRIADSAAMPAHASDRLVVADAAAPSQLTEDSDSLSRTNLDSGATLGSAFAAAPIAVGSPAGAEASGLTLGVGGVFWARDQAVYSAKQKVKEINDSIKRYFAAGEIEVGSAPDEIAKVLFEELKDGSIDSRGAEEIRDPVYDAVCTINPLGKNEKIKNLILSILSVIDNADDVSDGFVVRRAALEAKMTLFYLFGESSHLLCGIDTSIYESKRLALLSQCAEYIKNLMSDKASIDQQQIFLNLPNNIILSFLMYEAKCSDQAIPNPLTIEIKELILRCDIAKGTVAMRIVVDAEKMRALRNETRAVCGDVDRTECALLSSKKSFDLKTHALLATKCGVAGAASFSTISALCMGIYLWKLCAQRNKLRKAEKNTVDIEQKISGLRKKLKWLIPTFAAAGALVGTAVGVLWKLVEDAQNNDDTSGYDSDF